MDVEGRVPPVRLAAGPEVTTVADSPVRLPLKPMLAESIRPQELADYITDDRFAFEPKLDGHRLLVNITDGNVRFLNRRGESYSHSTPRLVAGTLAGVAGRWVLDGELVTGVLYCFDVLVADGVAVTGEAQQTRRVLLEELLGRVGDESVRLCPSVVSPSAKLELVRFLIDRDGEGVIVKRRDAAYLPGKRTRHLLKAKFEKEADCVVVAVGTDGKDNLTLGLFDQGQLVEVGRCTALAGDGARVRPGDVVTVKYLGVYDMAKPRLSQPTLPRLRTDKRPDECLLSQLRPLKRRMDEM